MYIYNVSDTNFSKSVKDLKGDTEITATTKHSLNNCSNMRKVFLQGLKNISNEIYIEITTTTKLESVFVKILASQYARNTLHITSRHRSHGVCLKEKTANLKFRC